MHRKNSSSDFTPEEENNQQQLKQHLLQQQLDQLQRQQQLQTQLQQQGQASLQQQQQLQIQLQQEQGQASQPQQQVLQDHKMADFHSSNNEKMMNLDVLSSIFDNYAENEPGMNMDTTTTTTTAISTAISTEISTATTTTATLNTPLSKTAATTAAAAAIGSGIPFSQHTTPQHFGSNHAVSSALKSDFLKFLPIGMSTSTRATPTGHNQQQQQQQQQRRPPLSSNPSFESVDSIGTTPFNSDDDSRNASPITNATNKTTESREKKRRRNRVAAKHCRERKKQYIKSLEEKMQEYEEERANFSLEMSRMRAENQKLSMEVHHLRDTLAIITQNAAPSVAFRPTFM